VPPCAGILQHPARGREFEKRLAEALEQQTATSEILRVISSSRTDVQPVFDTIVRSAVRLCDGLFGAVSMFDGEMVLRPAATYNYTPAAMAVVQRMYPIRPSRQQISGRAILSRTVAHMPDVLNDPEYTPDVALAGGWRGALAVPMLREGQPIGAILVTRAEAGPFSDQQIDLLKTFADQAVIAIENVRLFTELEEKNRALTEAHTQVTDALEQQTATAEILRVISRSQTNVQPVFDTIVANAVRLCRAHIGAVFQFDGELIHLVAHHNFTPEMLAALGRLHPRPPQRDTVSGRAILSRAVVQIEDILADREYHRGLAFATGWRSMIAVPMLREGEPIGTTVINRREPGPFTEQQIELLKTFADQAVIAIENVRLFTELQQKNEALTAAHAQVSKSLEQQRATAEVLKVISRSPIDVQPVFDTIVRNAVRLCDAVFGRVFRRDGETVLLAANANFPDELGHHPAPLNQDTLSGRVIITGRVHLSVDIESDPAITPRAHETFRHRGVRSILSDAPGRPGGRRHRRRAPGRGRVHGRARGAVADLRGPGRHRHRECAPVQGARGPNRRPDPLGRATHGPGRGRPGGQLDAGCRDGTQHDRLARQPARQR
jgi:GAF domain-containing protein